MLIPPLWFSSFHQQQYCSTKRMLGARSQICPRTCSSLNLSCWLQCPSTVPGARPGPNSAAHIHPAWYWCSAKKIFFPFPVSPLPWCTALSKSLHLLHSHVRRRKKKIKHLFRGSSRYYFSYHCFYQTTSSHPGVHGALWTATFKEKRHRNTQISSSSIWIYGWKRNYQLCNNLLLYNKTHGI